MRVAAHRASPAGPSPGTHSAILGWRGSPIPAHVTTILPHAMRARFRTDAPLRHARALRSGRPSRDQPGVSDSMGRRLYVGNLPYSATEEQLTELFGQAGKVDNVRVMRDMATGRARGFAFVEMAHGRRRAEGDQPVPRAADGRPCARGQRGPAEAGRRLWRRWRRTWPWRRWRRRRRRRGGGGDGELRRRRRQRNLAGRSASADAQSEERAASSIIETTGLFILMSNCQTCQIYSSTTQPSRSWMIRLP